MLTPPNLEPWMSKQGVIQNSVQSFIRGGGSKKSLNFFTNLLTSPQKEPPVFFQNALCRGWVWLQINIMRQFVIYKASDGFYLYVINPKPPVSLQRWMVNLSW